MFFIGIYLDDRKMSTSRPVGLDKAEVFLDPALVHLFNHDSRREVTFYCEKCPLLILGEAEGASEVL